ncbi:MAG TPA: hypothetical protein PLY93_04950, partial [Turneriella sp.]|nr:hypothetical protein [Turneriella sp.]
ATLPTTDIVNPPLKVHGKEYTGAVPFFTIALGSSLVLPNANTATEAQNTSLLYMLRQNEAIYTAPDAVLPPAEAGLAAMPALRIEGELPFTRLSLLPQWQKAAALFSLEVGFSTQQNLFSTTGNFRFLNNQAGALELTDVTYSGKIIASERKQYFSPMLGLSFEWWSYANVHFLTRAAVGFFLQNGIRTYHFNTDNQNITSVSNPTYSGSYHLEAHFTETYSYAFLAAGRLELGVRYEVWPKIHVALLVSSTVLYGMLPLDIVGGFTEYGNGKKTYEYVVSSIRDEASLVVLPSVFLALSYEL